MKKCKPNKKLIAKDVKDTREYELENIFELCEREIMNIKTDFKKKSHQGHSGYLRNQM